MPPRLELFIIWLLEDDDNKISVGFYVFGINKYSGVKI